MLCTVICLGYFHQNLKFIVNVYLLFSFNCFQLEALICDDTGEAEATSATFGAAKTRQENGEVELPDIDHGVRATLVENQYLP